MMLFVTKISLFVFLLCFSCPLWRSHGCRRYLLPTHPHTLPVAFQLAPKIYFRHFGYFYILGGGGAENWNILYNGTWALSICLDIVPSHLMHSRLSCACCINVDFLKSLLPKIEDSYFTKMINWSQRQHTTKASNSKFDFNANSVFAALPLWEAS